MTKSAPSLVSADHLADRLALACAAAGEAPVAETYIATDDSPLVASMLADLEDVDDAEGLDDLFAARD